MAKQIFTWYPDEGANESIKPDVTITKFGDGYEQRTARGINADITQWTMTFTGSSASGKDVLNIRTFLKSMGAVTSFQWTNPFGELGIYVCREYSFARLSAKIAQVSVKFDRVYEANV